jgi:tyrosyl-tRNA synthetase
MDELTGSEVEDIFQGVPQVIISKEEAVGLGVMELALRGGAVASKAEFKRLVKGGGVYLNNVREESAERALGAGDLIDGLAAVLRTGKKKQFLVLVRA